MRNRTRKIWLESLRSNTLVKFIQILFMYCKKGEIIFCVRIKKDRLKPELSSKITSGIIPASIKNQDLDFPF